MPIKRYKPEQIVTMLRQIEVGIANGKTTPQACKEAEGNRSRSGLGSAGAVVVTCVVLSTCQRWSLCVAILICDASIKTY
jgi:hypothetical protein